MTPEGVPYRVAALGHAAALGGAELALVRLVDAVDPAQVTVRTVLFADGPLKTVLEGSGHDVEVLPLNPALATAGRHAVGSSLRAGLRSVVAVLPFVWQLGRRLRALDVDVVYTTTLKADLIGVPAAWLAGRPLVWHVHDRISPDYLPGPLVTVIRTLARWAPRHVIVNSRATAATLPGVGHMSLAYPGLVPAQVIEDPRDRPAPAVPTVGILGRISPTKGQMEFVQAAARVLSTRPHVRFRIIGSAMFDQEDYEAHVHAEVARLGIGDRVEFVGFAPDPVAALDALTLCVHASPLPEPFGQVIAEAMARGVPVVATLGGGATEIVAPPTTDQPLGWLVPPGDVPTLAEAILEALDNPDEARRRAEAAWTSVRERFPIERTAAVVTEVWRSVARGR